MPKNQSRDVAGDVNVGEFAPVITPIDTGEIVSTRDTQSTRHSQTMPSTAPTGKMTKEWIPDSTPVQK
jgi:hypothetical protein